jgi:hypothetical protein
MKEGRWERRERKEHKRAKAASLKNNVKSIQLLASSWLFKKKKKK